MFKELYEINGVQFYATRRRYSNTTYTWVHVKNGDVFTEFAGDPWPCIMPKKTEVWAEYERWHAYHNPSPPRSSIWGAIQSCDKVCNGMWAISTPSHGGIFVAKVLHDTMPPSLKETRFSWGGYYEEDCDWVIPYIFFEDKIKAETDDEHSLKVLDRGYHRTRWENDAYYEPFRTALAGLVSC